ncbi:hypothetical protein U27_05164 [Candidatus Vecturithrix granuli]|uniref:Uncharacterized protein n=1 Tax=Vecturithrix granuli TaxID=1499967 RepID=A0A081C0T6_VECG1|nr:hypothetical protein U27_05164 [Candidatus Vecturithrix granuli]
MNYDMLISQQLYSSSLCFMTVLPYFYYSHYITNLLHIQNFVESE